MDRVKRCRLEKHYQRRASESDRRAGDENPHTPPQILRRAALNKQAIDARRKIGFVGNESGKERRETRRRAHARDADQGFRERKRAMLITFDSGVVGGPFREARPGAFKRSEGADERKSVGSKEEQQAHEIVACGMMSNFVAERGIELIWRKTAEKSARSN